MNYYNLNRSFIEFLGTYIALLVILYTSIKMPNYISLAVGLSFGILVFIFNNISANFNPAITLMFILNNKYHINDVIYLIVPQLLAAWFVIITYKYLF